MTRPRELRAANRSSRKGTRASRTSLPRSRLLKGTKCTVRDRLVREPVLRMGDGEEA